MGRTKRIAELRLRTRVEAATMLRGVADPKAPGETVRACIERAAARLRWTYGRTEDIWRMEAHRIEAWEMDQLRDWRPD